MKQASLGLETLAKRTRKAAFLAEREQVVPWVNWLALSRRTHPKAGVGNRHSR